MPYLEADAKDKWEKYVLRKGFMGRGLRAHSYAYHICKQQHLRSVISHNIRKGKRNRPILLLNGARVEESGNRKRNMTTVVRSDPAAKPNLWVNIIHYWEKKDCVEFLDGLQCDRNPVTKLLCRSGECMCGTMQSQAQREEAAYWYPEWGKQLDALEKRVIANGFPWKWGEHISKRYLEKKAGQLDIFDDWLPMCHSCTANEKR
jgi:hypothetical protein